MRAQATIEAILGMLDKKCTTQVHIQAQNSIFPSRTKSSENNILKRAGMTTDMDQSSCSRKKSRKNDQSSLQQGRTACCFQDACAVSACALSALRCCSGAYMINPIPNFAARTDCLLPSVFALLFRSLHVPHVSLTCRCD